MVAFAGVIVFYKGRDYQVQRFLDHCKRAQERRDINAAKRGPDEGLIGI
jgi:hypothetical protein